MTPVVPVLRVFYPTLYVDNSGQVRQSAKMLRLPMKYDDFGWQYEPTIIDKLIEIDKTIRTKNKPVGSNDKIQSVFEGGY